MESQNPSDPLFETALSAASLWPPRLTSELSAWNEHIPFAGWIVEAAQPDVLVELGSHAGVSYFAFCESVRRLDIDTRCFAVDTWVGDEHAGFYDEDIYSSVKELNDQYYGSFSRLIRSTFDEAIDEFEDSSVDLLHIDGLHTYDAIRHDFETWLPKLSSRGVVLLHDTTEQKAGFGVYRFFSELAERYPTFEFTHGHGLGVIAVGEGTPEAVERLMELGAEAGHAAQIRDLYAALGRRLSAELTETRLSDALTEAKEVGHRTQVVLDQKNDELHRIHRVLGVKNDEIKRMQERLASGEERLEQLRVRVADSERRHKTAQRDARLIAEQLEQSQAETAAALAETKRVRGDLSKANHAYRRLRSRRSVRIALGLAALFQPLFRGVRRLRKGSSPATTVALRTTGQQLTIRAVGGQAPKWDAKLPQDVCTIIIPVFNAYEEVQSCLRSVVRNTTGEARLLIIDDASTDERIPPLLAEYGTRGDVEVLTNDENLGFVRTVNRGFEASSGDVVLLNSDVEVPPGWLDRLRLAAQTNPRVGTVTALSDNAGAFSAPEFGRPNAIPMAVTRDQLGRGVAQTVQRRYARTPTGNGFCMLIRRDCIDDIGLFDADAFPRGYGEENDFCMRASQKGWLNIIDESTFVLHARSASFGEDKHELMRAGRRVLDERYPDYTRLVRDFAVSNDMADSRAAIADTFAAMNSGELQPRPRVLFVLHAAGGGTPATTRDLIAGLDSTYEAFVLISNGAAVWLERHMGDVTEELFRVRLEQPIRPDDFAHDEYRRIAAGVMVRYAIDTVHIRHLIGHSFDVPAVARSLGIPVVLSFHDFYYVCPTVHLMDNEGTFCGGVCTSGQGECSIPTPWLEGLPHLKHEWVYEWRKRALEMFESVDAFVTASQSTRSYYLEVFPELEQRRFTVIEHGRQFTLATPPVGALVAGRARVRILLAGNLGPHKGSLFVKRLAELDRGKRLEFHVLGWVDPELEGIVVEHGTYSRDDFAELARQVAPSFIGLFSTTAESHSHVLSESWAAGIPVLASNLGALEGRIDRHGGGWVLDIEDPEGTYQRILEIASDRQGYEEQLAMTRQAAAALRTIDEMAFDYRILYGKLRDQRRGFRAKTDDAGAVRVGAFMPDQGGGFAPSSEVRIIGRLEDPALANDVVWRLVTAERFLSMDPGKSRIELAVVQRNAIPSSMADDFVEQCRRGGIGIVFDIDDDLLNDDPDWRERDHYEPFRHSIETLAAAASVVTVSTPALAERMAEFNSEVVILPNALVRSLWLRSVDSDLHPPKRRAAALPGPNLVYFGGSTHGRDLEIIRPVLELVRSSIGPDAQLTVIGGVQHGDRAAWFQSIDIPADRRRYSRFAPWVQSMSSEFDIGVAPLENTPLNRYKSDLRFLEYSAGGLAGVYSKAEAFASVKDGVDGLIVDNTPQAWAEAIVRLWNDPELREGIRHRALEYVANERLISQQSEEYLALLRSVRDSVNAIARSQSG